jgi:hypothetical protein
MTPESARGRDRLRHSAEMRPPWFRRVVLALALLLAPGARGAEESTTAGGVPLLRHVFVIVEENMGFDDVAVTHAAEAPYLNGLARAHVRHEAYYAITHPSLGNYTAMLSGQVPIWFEQWNCPLYRNCIRRGPTLVDQLEAKGLTWRGYFESMPFPCARPTGLRDEYRSGYATRHNPFVYFEEIVGDEAYCRKHVVPYEKSFAEDLDAGPPNFALIVPNTCNDGHDAGCRAGKTQLEVLDGWLKENVPPILRFVDENPGAALIITFDEAETGDRSGCCTRGSASGGGRVDLVVVAPGLERAAGYRSKVPANHYSLLRTLEEGFRLPPLGEAAHVAPMSDLFTATN